MSLARSRRLLLGAGAALAALAAAAWLSAVREGLPDFETRATRLEAAGVPLPVLMLDAANVVAGNDLAAVFVDRSQADRTTLTLVFVDEDHPIWGLDQAYDQVRWRSLHREADVEGLEIIHGSATPAAIRFSTTYGGAQTFGVWVPRHLSETVAWEQIETSEDGRPRVYVTTWNHMMSERDTNPDRAKVEAADYPVYAGSRADVEALFQAVWQAR